MVQIKIFTQCLQCGTAIRDWRGRPAIDTIRRSASFCEPSLWRVARARFCTQVVPISCPVCKRQPSYYAYYNTTAVQANTGNNNKVSYLMLNSGRVLCSCTSHIGQNRLVSKYLTMQDRQTVQKNKTYH